MQSVPPVSVSLHVLCASRIFNNGSEDELWASSLLRSGYVHVVEFNFVLQIEMHLIYNEAGKFIIKN